MTSFAILCASLLDAGGQSVDELALEDQVDGDSWDRAD